MKKSVEAIVDLNLKLEIEVNELGETISKKEQPTNYAQSLQILIAVLNNITNQRTFVQPFGRAQVNESNPQTCISNVSQSQIEDTMHRNEHNQNINHNN